MRSDVHSSALRAAAKVAFSVAFVSGCSAPISPADLTDDERLEGAGGDGVEPGTSESEISSGQAKPKAKAKRGATATRRASECDKHQDASAPKPLTCDQVVNAAFPTDGDYPGAKQAVSAQVQTCCAELLASSEGMMGAHRWDCCANLPADAGQNVGIACTPWGPPVPPSMQRRVA